MARSFHGLTGCVSAAIAFASIPVAAGETVTIEATADNTLYENASGALSNGSGDHFFVGRNANGARRRGLLQFDVAASIPADAMVTSVELTLFMSRTQAGPTTVTLHRAATAWGEGTSDASGQEGGGTAAAPGDATWIHSFYDTDSWATAGGDYELAASTSQSVGGVGSYTFSNATMATDVQAWIDTPGQNFGWLLLGNEASSETAKRFDTRENTATDRRPRLTINFETNVEPTNTYYQDSDGDTYGDPLVFVETTKTDPPVGFVVDGTDCDDTNPDINPGVAENCDNGIDDNCDGVTDCGVDCNANGICDLQDIADGTNQDCDNNGVPDVCDIANGTQVDQDVNGIPDACEVLCCNGVDPRALLMRYTGETCAGTSHNQDPDDVECDDFAPPPTMAYIIVSDDEDPFDGDADVWFTGVVEVGGLFLADAVTTGDLELDSRLHIHIFDASGTTRVQSVEFRTECEYPLSVGDQFGASLIVECASGTTPIGPTCLTDLDHDGMTGLSDVIALLNTWSTAGPADVNCDGTIGFSDLILLLGQWGPC